MNQIVQSAAEFTSPPLSLQKINSNTKKLESMLTRIKSGLVKIWKAFRIDDDPMYRHKSFIEENLLDKRVGPEIIRTLR